VLEYERDSFQLAVAGGGNVVGLERIADEYGGSNAGQLAKFYAGTSYLHMKNLEKGLELLEDYKKGRTMVSAAAYAAIGYAHEQKGEFAEAASAYEEASSTPSENAFSTPFYLMQAARNHESAGNNDAALKHYRTIKKDYPASPEGQNIDKYIAKLSAEDE
jgi:tetratricopeptide (TPR) repeat protein